MKIKADQNTFSFIERKKVIEATPEATAPIVLITIEKIEHKI